MKIFTLQSKTSLLTWSIFLGLLINHGLRILVQSNSCLSYGDPIFLPSNTPLEASMLCEKVGWPIAAYNGFVGFTWSLYFLNGLLWVFIIFIVLSAIKHFKNKQNKLTPNI